MHNKSIGITRRRLFKYCIPQGFASIVIIFERPKQRCHGTHVLRILLSVQKLRCQIYCEAYTCDLLTSNVTIVCDNNHIFYWIQRKCNNIVHLFLHKCSLRYDLILRNEKASLACNGFVCHISNIKGLPTRPGTYGYIYMLVLLTFSGLFLVCILFYFLH